jgi:hypothetical protein
VGGGWGLVDGVSKLLRCEMVEVGFTCWHYCVFEIA